MALDQILKRHFWAAILLLTAVAAFLGATGVTQLVGVGLAVDETALTAPPPAPRLPPGTTAASTRNLSAEPILARNPFDSQTGPLNRVELAPEDGLPSAPTDLSNQDPNAAPPCEGIKVLIIAASSDPEWSFAAIQAPGDTKSILRRRGMDVPGGKKVAFVGWDRVWMVNGGALCQAEMFKGAEVAKVAAAPAPATPPPATGGPGAVPDDIKKGIVRVSGTEFNVDRGVVEKILENQADLMRQARIVPEQENGKLVGIRLFGVRPDTLLGTLGMENGDRLQTINGFDMTSPEKALEAYARLRTADHLTVQVNRRGQNQNLDFNIK